MNFRGYLNTGFMNIPDIVAAAVLSGNRNFEGRVHPLTRANYLASPPLVVAYALAGTVCSLSIVSKNEFKNLLLLSNLDFVCRLTLTLTLNPLG